MAYNKVEKITHILPYYTKFWREVNLARCKGFINFLIQNLLIPILLIFSMTGLYIPNFLQPLVLTIAILNMCSLAIPCSQTFKAIVNDNLNPLYKASGYMRIIL